jgi:hypothetical protein
MGLRRILGSAVHLPLRGKLYGLILLCDDLVWAALQQWGIPPANSSYHAMQIKSMRAWHAVKPVHVVRIATDQLKKLCESQHCDQLRPMTEAFRHPHHEERVWDGENIQ